MQARTVPPALLTALAIILTSCSSDPATTPSRSFLEGASDDPQIGLLINSTGRALTMFQLGDPAGVPVGLILRLHRLIDVGRDDIELNARRPQQLGSSRRCRGKNQPRALPLIFLQSPCLV